MYIELALPNSSLCLRGYVQLVQRVECCPQPREVRGKMRVFPSPRRPAQMRARAAEMNLLSVLSVRILEMGLRSSISTE